MKNILLVLYLLSYTGFAVAQTNATGSVKQSPTIKMGVSDRAFADSNRSNWLGNGPRPLRSVIWYPAGNGGKEEITNDPYQFSGPTQLIRDAAIAGTNKYPLIIISHGSQGKAIQMRWLGYYLASKGFIAIAIDHNGTPEEERNSQPITMSDFCMWERPTDITVVLNKILRDPFFASRIDTSRIGIAGFSLGGATAIWTAGAILDVNALGKSDPNPPVEFKAAIDKLIALSKTDPLIINSIKHSGDSFKDKRIKAVFALAPAIGGGFGKAGLQNVTVPVQIVVGAADVVAPMDQNAKHYTDNLPKAKKLIVLPGERGHYTKQVPVNERRVELEEVSEIAYRFFKDSLKVE